MRLRSDGIKVHVVLQGAVDIFEAQELRRIALEALQAPEGVIVSLEETTRVDTAAGQILLALKRALVDQGKSFALEAPPTGVKETWRLLGFIPSFEEP